MKMKYFLLFIINFIPIVFGNSIRNIFTNTISDNFNEKFCNSQKASGPYKLKIDPKFKITTFRSSENFTKYYLNTDEIDVWIGYKIKWSCYTGALTFGFNGINDTTKITYPTKKEISQWARTNYCTIPIDYYGWGSDSEPCLDEHYITTETKSYPEKILNKNCPEKSIFYHVCKIEFGCEITKGKLPIQLSIEDNKPTINIVLNNGSIFSITDKEIYFKMEDFIFYSNQIPKIEKKIVQLQCFNQTGLCWDIEEGIYLNKETHCDKTFCYNGDYKKFTTYDNHEASIGDINKLAAELAYSHEMMVHNLMVLNKEYTNTNKILTKVVNSLIKLDPHLLADIMEDNFITEPKTKDTFLIRKCFGLARSHARKHENPLLLDMTKNYEKLYLEKLDDPKFYGIAKNDINWIQMINKLQTMHDEIYKDPLENSKLTTPAFIHQISTDLDMVKYHGYIIYVVIVLILLLILKK